MAATVSLRSGLTRHWTGSLLDLDCSSEAALDNCLEKSTEYPFRVNWGHAAPSSLKNLNNNEYTRLIRDANGSDACIYGKSDGSLESGFSKTGLTEGIAAFTTNQLFRLRQLFSILRRHFHHKYDKNTSELWKECSWNSNTSVPHTSPLDDSNLSYTSNQSSMWSSEHSISSSEGNRCLPTFFSTDFEHFFHNESSFFVITKSKRRHCNSESDLTFFNPGRCSVVQKETLSHSVSNISVPSTSPVNNDNDPEDEKEQSKSISESVSCSSLDTLFASEQVSVEEANAESMAFPDQSDQLSEMCTSERLHDSTKIADDFILMPDQEREKEEEHTQREDVENEMGDYDREVTPTLPEAESTVIITLEDTDITDSNNHDRLPASENVDDETTDQMTYLVPASRTSPSNLSSLHSTKMDRENSITSTSSSRMAKTVSFADEVGRSLTEVFLFSKAEDDCLIPDYDDEYDGPFLSFVRKPKSSTFERFSRSRVKRCTDAFFEASCNNQHTQTFSPTSLLETRPPAETKDTERSVWVLGFNQPAAQYYEFRQRVENACVSLENMTLTQPEDNHNIGNDPSQSERTAHHQFPYLSGTIKVKNVAFDKCVWLRLTTDQWKTHMDFPAVYNAELSSGSARSPARFDTFTFQILPTSFPRDSSNTDRIEFAIRYSAGPDGSSGQFWDNNDGQNYVIERRRMEYHWPVPHSPSHSPVESSIGLFTSLPDYLQSPVPKVTPGCNPYTTDYRPNFAGFTSFTDYRAWEHFASETIYY